MKWPVSYNPLRPGELMRPDALMNYIIIYLAVDLLPIRQQAITWTNVDIPSLEPRNTFQWNFILNSDSHIL